MSMRSDTALYSATSREPGPHLPATYADLWHATPSVARDAFGHGFGRPQTSPRHVVVLIPYSRSRLKKKVTFGQISGTAGQPNVWRQG
jgi:hypothetical protein